MNYRKCLDDAVLLVEEANLELSIIEELYFSSIKKTEIDNRLLIKIKGTFEHLRSSLDFVAQGIALKYDLKNKRNIYFPYARLGVDRETFVNEKRIEKSLPGLEKIRPDIVKFIMDMQHFSHEGAKWFPEFMELNNKNKHVHLVPQGLSKAVSLEFNGNQILAHGITIGESGSIKTKNGTLKGPLEITTENVNEFDGSGIFEAKAWEAIYIKGYGFPMNTFEFVRHCVCAISTVVKQFKSMLLP